MEHCIRRPSARGSANVTALILTLIGLAGGSALPIASSSLSARSTIPPPESDSRSLAQPLPQATSGGRLVFERVDVHSPTQAGTGIYIVEADGTNLRRLNSVGFEPALSIDGTKLAFVTGQMSSGCNNYELNIMPSIFGTDRRPLTNVCGYDQHPTWSPDGTKLAFWSDRDAGEGLYVMNADGSQQTRILSTSSLQRLIESPHWSPDGTRITFVGYNLGANNEADVFVVNADGSNPLNITSTPAINEVAPAWSRDNNKIAYIRLTSPDDSAIYTMNANGSNKTQLTNLSITGLGLILGLGQLKLAWSPDGTRLAFMDVGNSLDIFAVNADGSNRVNLTNTPDNDTYPDWQVAAPAPTTNTIDEAQFFVRLHYIDFLNREPDPDGLDYWTEQITQCGTTSVCVHHRRIDVSAAFFVEQEFQRTGSFVYRMYKASYGGRPTFLEFEQDRAQIVEGPNLEQTKIAFANQWVNSGRFKAFYPQSLSNTEFVNELYDKAWLTPFTAERQQQVDAMNMGRTRAEVLRAVVEIQALKDREYNPSFVVMQYFAYLQRDAEQGGYDFWLDVLNNREPNNYRGMVCAFITSREYQERFGTVVTRSNQDCAL